MEQRGQIGVVIQFQDDIQILKCDRHVSIAEVGQMWQDATGRHISVGFVAPGEKHLSDDLPIVQALTSPSAISLELRAYPKSKYQIQVFGFEDSSTQLEIAPSLRPAALRRTIERAVEIHTDDFRLTCDGEELDQELPFNEQGLGKGAQLIVDLRVIVKVKFEENDELKTLHCYCSDSIGDLRQRLNCNDDVALASVAPYCHVLDDSLRVCHIVSDILDLEVPIHLNAEKKVMLTFEPITCEHLQQHLPVALSCTPLDIYDLVRERFQLATEFRLAVNGQYLDNLKPLIEQLITIHDIIQIDILRPFVVSDMWKSIMDEDSIELVYLYSTESPNALYLRDELSDQRLYYDDINLAIFGSVVDVFGAITGMEKPMMLVDRDVQRNFPMLTFDGVVQRLGWARDLMIDVVSTTRGLLPKEVMRNGHLLPAKRTLSNLHLAEDTLTIMDPEKIFISSDKKLQMCRFGHGATLVDIRERMQQVKRCRDIGLKIRDWSRLKMGEWKLPAEAMNRKLDRELLFLTKESRYKTQLIVTMNNRWFSCRFEAAQVRFTDLMIDVGKQLKTPPRCLFRKQLYCSGCRRQISQEEEPHQMIPAACCSVKSLRLTDRRMTDVGVQSAGSRRCEVATITDAPETRGPASAPVRVFVENPQGTCEQRSVSVRGANCRALLAAADRQLAEVALGDSPIIFSEEVTYDRGDEERTALLCFDGKEGGYTHVDLRDGGSPDRRSWRRIYRRFLRPSSPLLPGPGLPPLIYIETETDLLAAAPRRSLQAAPPAALTDPAFVALLRGVQSGAELFWKLAGAHCFVNAKSGRVFETKEIPGGPARFVLALLRDKDPVPRAAVPEGSCLQVLHRAGLELRVERGRVRSSELPLSADDMDLWSTAANAGAFEAEFTAAARK